MSKTKKAKVVIRSYRPSDRAEVCTVVVEAYGEKDMYKLIRADLTDAVSNAKSRPEFVVAELQTPGERNRVIGVGGFIMAWRHWRIYELFWLAVHPDFRNMGVGAKLVRERLKIISLRHNSLLVEVATIVPKYLKRFGFKQTGRLGDGDTVLMRRKVYRRKRVF